MTTANPVVLFNSSTGSDTAASGAGPATALTGSNASVAGTSTSVSITDAVDLSGVATDGSAVLWYNDTTAGHKNFSQITAVSGSSGAWTVTVASGYTTSTGPFSWAIGGKRASITNSLRLVNNNGSSGDAAGSWTAQFDSGYTETLSSTLTLTVSESFTTTGGVFTFQGDPAAGTMPVLTFSNNGQAIGFQNSSGAILANLELQNSNATKTGSTAITDAGANVTLRNIKIKDSTNYFNVGISVGVSSNTFLIEGCEIAHCHTYGIQVTGGSSFPIFNNFIHDNTSHGIYISSSTAKGIAIFSNIIYKNGGKGIYDNSNFSYGYTNYVLNNTIDSNTSDGIYLATATSGSNMGMPIVNNIISNNGGYGIHTAFTTANQAQAYAMVIEGNDFYNNTSGKYNNTSLPSANEQTTDPTFTNAASGDFSIGTNLAAKGYPVGGSEYIGNYSATYTYTDIGAAQRQATGGGGATGYAFCA